MSDTDDPALAAARLEEALERIATLADALSAREVAAREAAEREATLAQAAAPAGAAGENVAMVAERLDALIAQLRGALAPQAA